MKTSRKLFTQEQEDFIRANVVGIITQELANLVNKRFKLNITNTQMMRWKCSYHMKSGLDGYFKKGHVPQNKGKRMSKEAYDLCKATMFKKGHTPHNHREIGSQRINIDGYCEIKVEEPNKWKLKHRVVWEKEHGPIPKGNAVIFADGNKTNFEIDNLLCVSRRELVKLNKNKIISNNADITRTYVGIVKLQNAIIDRKRREENEKM